MQDQNSYAFSPITQAFLPLTLIRSGGLPLSAWESMSQGMPDWVGIQVQENKLVATISIYLDQLLQQLPEGQARTAVYNARKAFFKHRKIMAIPAIEPKAGYPVWENLQKTLQQWGKLQQDKQAASSAFQAALENGMATLQRWAHDPVLRSGLLYSSHALLRQLDTFASENTLRKKERQTAMALLQYLSRTIFKTSPFSVFTTLSVQHFVPDDREALGQWFSSRATVTPNVGLLPFLYEVLLRDPGFAERLTLRLNPSLRLSDHRVYSWLYFDGAEEAFQEMPAQPLVDYVFKYLSEAKGKVSFQELSKLLVTTTEDNAELVDVWLNRLLDIGFLDREWPEKGLSPGWCGGLYQYLGFQPSSPGTIAVAYFLQWLRTTARTLPFQSPETVMEMQQAALDQLQQLLLPNQVDMPAIPPEQVFYEDVFQDSSSWISPAGWSTLHQELHKCWLSKKEHQLPEYRAALVLFAREKLSQGTSMAFLDFCQAFMDATPQSAVVWSKPYKGKVGAVVQVYQENGTYGAVVNGMYAGGGRLFSRWLGQMSPEDGLIIKNWIQEGRAETAPYPFPGWSNVHFQPPLATGSIRVPDERIAAGQAVWQTDLSRLEVILDADGMPVLWDPERSSTVFINDLGLEAPDQLPPVRRLLWYLGVPYVSLDALLPETLVWEEKDGIKYRPRASSGSLMLSRASWFIPEESWRNALLTGQSDLEQVRNLILKCHEWGVPRYFFGRFTEGREKPQFYDQKSPVSMALLVRNLQKGGGGLLWTEMLPLPDQYPAGKVQEYVLEWDAGLWDAPTLSDGETLR